MSATSTIHEDNEIPHMDAVPEDTQAAEPQPEVPSNTAGDPSADTRPVPSPIVPPSPTRPVASTRLSASSVVSLPLLNMMRGVPFGNRAPLMVTNPDLASSTSGSARNTIIESAGADNQLSNALDQALQQRQQPTTPDASPSDRYKPKKSSPLAVSRSGSETSSSHDSPKSEASRRTGGKAGDSDEILIVLLDEKSNHTWHGMEKNLERKRTKTSIRTSSGDRHSSPWLTPLLPAEKTTYRPGSIRQSQSNPRPSRKRGSPFGSASSFSLSSSPSNSASNSDYDSMSDSDDDSYTDDSTGSAKDWALKRKDWPEQAMPVIPSFPMKKYLVSEGLLPPDQPNDAPVAPAIAHQIRLHQARAQHTQLARNASIASYSAYGSPYVSPADIPLPPSVVGSVASYSRGPTPQPGIVAPPAYPPHPSVAMAMGSPLPGMQVAMSASTYPRSPRAMTVPPGYAMSAAPGSPWASPHTRLSTPYLPGFVPYTQ
ncbi:hypothetical protein HGRIS_008636 [Hohenbuehelia grisea]|uniref:Uncharacterized protein n=1 Tax=Hohenbuehelia grisea TaxID=104357 RepID=A0ABR3J944_9AGAR